MGESTSSARRLPLPAALTQGRPLAFVGRQEELQRLLARWREAVGGSAQAALIAGDPGIGKTRLAAELGAATFAEGAMVLYGRCDEELLVPYQPFVEALKPYALSRSQLVIRAHVGPLVGELARLPGLETLISAPISAPPTDPDTERYRLFQAVTSLVAGAASEAPVVLVLDDLHWADRGTLLLLRYLLRHTKAVSMLVVGTYRDVGLSPSHSLTAVLADLRQDRACERVALRGFSPDEVATMLGAASDATGDDRRDLASVLHRQTDGNPFYVTEMIRHLAEPDAANAPGIVVPESVHEVIDRRLSRLSPQAVEALTIGSVFGREFSITELEAVSSTNGELLDVMEELLAAGVVHDLFDRPLWYSFSHALIRESLYSQLSRSRRTRLHLQVGEALEALYGPDPKQRLAGLAYHFLHALPQGDIDKAVGYARAAGAQALVQLAYEEAAGHFAAAAEALALHTTGRDRTRADILVELADALWRAGEAVEARQAVLEAAALARAATSPELLARVALGLASSWVLNLAGHLGQVATVDAEAVALLEEALDVTPETDSPLRAQLLGQLAAALYWSPEHERRMTLSLQAVEMATRTGDRGALAETLFARRLALWGPEDVEERLVADAQIQQLAEQVGDTWRTLDARLWRAMDLLELGDLAAADDEIRRHAALASELKQPEPRWNSLVVRAMRALLDGRYEEAESLATEALAIGQDLFEAPSLATYGGLMLWAWREQGRVEELEAAMNAILGAVAQLPGTQAGLALTYIDLGRREEARQVFEQLAAHDFVDFPRDLAWLGMVAVLSLVCADLHDSGRAAALYRMLLPFEDRNLVLLNCLCLGPGSYYLGVLAATMDEPEVAAIHFERAASRCLAMGARPALANTRLALAELLVQRAGPDDLTRAKTLLEEASATARQLGMAPLAARAAALESRMG